LGAGDEKKSKQGNGKKNAQGDAEITKTKTQKVLVEEAKELRTMK